MVIFQIVLQIDLNVEIDTQPVATMTSIKEQINIIRAVLTSGR